MPLKFQIELPADISLDELMNAAYRSGKTYLRDNPRKAWTLYEKRSLVRTFIVNLIKNAVRKEET